MSQVMSLRNMGFDPSLLETLHDLLGFDPSLLVMSTSLGFCLLGFHKYKIKEGKLVCLVSCRLIST